MGWVLAVVLYIPSFTACIPVVLTRCMGPQRGILEKNYVSFSMPGNFQNLTLIKKYENDVLSFNYDQLILKVSVVQFGIKLGLKLRYVGSKKCWLKKKSHLKFFYTWRGLLDWCFNPNTSIFTALTNRFCKWIKRMIISQ